ncbi:hypothetical protein UB31_07010 [Bradyrhizobium sp. LTSP849]|jgi:hypothetical protein|uniref:hypothetical protein n=1 Tax=unclassified Bradyrhizobium TaxID=2631580 RepID=UPI0005D26E21|nr:MULTISPECIES: hypothetical protein [unclassified Bradyrhizobium]KJC37665.1 hypothetical protein UP06_30080 [Bradyrhizobium sp. LTSP857]KJC53752.1 hypothetical protein UB31_07010 [Bradyrhizobium sp. LTSP849]
MEANSHEALVGEFLAEINTAIENHGKAYTWDTFWYQSIVVTSAICGILSLIFGTAANDPKVAGIFGGITTIGTVLTQTLHCVKAQGWQSAMKTELEAIRLQLVYEHASPPSAEALADLSKQYRDLKLRMAAEWQRLISSQPGGINLKGKGNKNAAE